MKFIKDENYNTGVALRHISNDEMFEHDGEIYVTVGDPDGLLSKRTNKNIPCVRLNPRQGFRLYYMYPDTKVTLLQSEIRYRECTDAEICAYKDNHRDYCG